MHDLLHLLSGTGPIRAIGVAFPLATNQQRITVRAIRREGPRFSARLTATRHRRHDFGNDVTRLAHDDLIAGANVFEANLIFVVQGGHLHGGPRHDDGLEDRVWRDASRAAHRDFDGNQCGGLLLGRQFAGNGPARGPRGISQSFASGQIIHLVDEPVNVITKVMASSREAVLSVHYLRGSHADSGFCGHIETPRGQLRENVAVARKRRHLVAGVHY